MQPDASADKLVILHPVLVMMCCLFFNNNLIAKKRWFSIAFWSSLADSGLVFYQNKVVATGSRSQPADHLAYSVRVQLSWSGYLLIYFCFYILFAIVLLIDSPASSSLSSSSTLSFDGNFPPPGQIFMGLTREQEGGQNRNQATALGL